VHHHGPVASSPRHRVIHAGPSPWSQSMARGPTPHIFPLENNSKPNNPHDFAESPLYLFNIKSWPATFRTKPQKFKNNYRLTLATFQKLQIGLCNFLSPYLCNRNYDFIDSHAKMLRVTSSFILCIHLTLVHGIYFLLMFALH
jgi:hypothetical protein